MTHVLVVGGGIGGLTAAIALGRRGHRVTLRERAPAFAPVGAGIVLAANAIAILRALGVDLSTGQPLAAMQVCRADGAPLSRVELGSAGWDVRAFHRAELHAALVAALPAQVEVHLGSAVEERQAAEFELVVGADGLRSGRRAAVHGDRPLRYCGETCWRAVVPGVSVQQASETWGPGRRMGIVPLPGERAYVFLTDHAPADAPAPPWDTLRARYAGLGGDCPEVLAALDRSIAAGASLLHHDLVELESPVWGDGRTWLLGDAAHAMTPNQGQGAGMAIEDAAALALALDDRAADPDTRHAAYVARRHARVSTVQRHSRRLGQVAGWTHPLLAGARDALSRLTPASTLHAHYRRLVDPGLELAAAL